MEPRSAENRPRRVGKSIAESIVDHLIQAGVERIYGVVGDSLNPLVDAIRRSGGKIEWIHVRHEEAGAFAASAEAQLTGKLAVCAGSCGPGHVHLINGLYDAHRSGAPVLAIAAHILSGEIGTAYFQETHPERLFEECSHYCTLVGSPKQMPRTLQIAMQEAVGKGGVSVIVMSGDVAAEESPEGALSHTVFPTRPRVRPADAELLRLADLLNEADKVTLFCGIGRADARDEVMGVAERLKAPVGHTMRGKDSVQFDNPNDVGMNGLLGYGACNDAMHGCDVLVLLGTDWPYENFYPTHCKIVQIDLRPERLGRRSRLDLGLCGDVGETLAALLPHLEPKADRAFLDKMLKEHAHGLRKMRAYVDHVGSHRPMHPEPVSVALDEIAEEDAIFTVDTGMCNVWTSRYLRSTRGRRMIGSYVHGSMANSMPMSIGAQLAFPNRQVIAVCGDGGFTMLMGDLLTIAQYDLPVKIVVFNNSSLGMVRLEMQVASYPFYGTEMKNPSFAALAEAVGLKGVRIEDPADLKDGLREGLAAPGPVLIDAVTDPNALSIPPKATLEQAKGFALSMGKMVLSGHLDEAVDEMRSNVRNLL